MPTAELGTVAMWYDERGHGDPCVLLHPGGAGVDSRALTPGVFHHDGWAGRSRIGADDMLVVSGL
jgi:hypothetical protein